MVSAGFFNGAEEVMLYAGVFLFSLASVAFGHSIEDGAVVAAFSAMGIYSAALFLMG